MLKRSAGGNATGGARGACPQRLTVREAYLKRIGRGLSPKFPRAPGLCPPAHGACPKRLTVREAYLKIRRVGAVDGLGSRSLRLRHGDEDRAGAQGARRRRVPDGLSTASRILGEIVENRQF